MNAVNAAVDQNSNLPVKERLAAYKLKKEKEKQEKKSGHARKPLQPVARANQSSRAAFNSKTVKQAVKVTSRHNVNEKAQLEILLTVYLQILIAHSKMRKAFKHQQTQAQVITFYPNRSLFFNGR